MHDMGRLFATTLLPLTHLQCSELYSQQGGRIWPRLSPSPHSPRACCVPSRHSSAEATGSVAKPRERPSLLHLGVVSAWAAPPNSPSWEDNWEKLPGEGMNPSLGAGRSSGSREQAELGRKTRSFPQRVALHA